ncbi:MAG TPA: nucleoside permease [Bryobacteraceae bacterium]|nr:nucleoside permease [Bryobacteraceae bacterium]
MRSRLSAMMFLNYVVWGAWYVTLNTYLTSTLHFTGTQAGAVFGTTALASMISPFFVGIVADRIFSTERVLAVLHFIGAFLLWRLASARTFAAVYGMLLVYCLCYFPTIALTNSLTMQHLKDPGRDFPLIRVFGTLGWIAIGIAVGSLAIEKSATPFLLASAASVVMGFFSLMLPHTPAAANGEAFSVRRVLGLDALGMLKDKSFLVFSIASVLACIPLTFYFSFTNDYLNDVHVANAAGKMTLGQVSEVGMMLVMPWVLRRVSVKGILIMGLAAWSLRYALLAFGDAGTGVWMFYLAILVHGVCYDFFFMTGQLYTDQQAPAHLRSAAQGFITFMTYGIGMYAGSLISGNALDFFTTGSGVHDWKTFWLSSAAGAFVILLIVAALFRSKARIEATYEV